MGKTLCEDSGGSEELIEWRQRKTDGEDFGCPELRASRRSSPRQRTRRGPDDGRGTGPNPRRTIVKLPGCARGERRVRGCCECANEGGVDRVGTGS
jgi:hypothetical protein